MTKHSQGFSIVELVVILGVVLAAGCGGWYVWQRGHKNKPVEQPNSSNQSGTKKIDQQDQATPDPYEGWKSYNNVEYGVSFKYPADWRIEEVGDDAGEGTSPDALISVKFAINAKRNVEIKYNNTFSIEVLNQNLEEAAKGYDKYFGQAQSNAVTKTTTQLKGRRSVQYAFPGTEAREKYYLLAVGNRSYLFRSINEELNLQADSGYWTEFSKVFDSLEISS